MLLNQKKAQEAELKLREALAIREKLNPDEWPVYDTQSMLGEALLDQKKFSEAEPLLLTGYEGLKEVEDKLPGPDKPAACEKRLVRLIQLYDTWGKKETATMWRKNLQAAKAENLRLRCGYPDRGDPHEPMNL